MSQLKKTVIFQSITLLSPSHAQTSGTLQSVWASPPQRIISAWICINSKWNLTKYVNWYTRKKNHFSFEHTRWNSFILINSMNIRLDKMREAFGNQSEQIWGGLEYDERYSIRTSGLYTLQACTGSDIRSYTSQNSKFPVSCRTL